MTGPSTDGFGVMPSATWFPEPGKRCAACSALRGPGWIDNCDCDVFCGEPNCGAHPEAMDDLRANLGRRLGREYQS